MDRCADAEVAGAGALFIPCDRISGRWDPTLSASAVVTLCRTKIGQVPRRDVASMVEEQETDTGNNAPAGWRSFVEVGDYSAAAPSTRKVCWKSQRPEV